MLKISICPDKTSRSIDSYQHSVVSATRQDKKLERSVHPAQCTNTLSAKGTVAHDLHCSRRILEMQKSRKRFRSGVQKMDVNVQNGGTDADVAGHKVTD
jgi:hypothetical protein